MAGAIAGGLVRRDAAMARVITAFDPNPAAVETFKENTQANAVSSDVVGLADKAQVILIAVKPQMINEALAPLTGKLKDKLIISIAAGITLERLYELTQSERIVRVMPNTPALVGAGISVFTDSGKLSENDAKITLEILSSIGKALPVAERMLDAVTGLSGCGPAYVFDFLIALAAGGGFYVFAKQKQKKQAEKEALDPDAGYTEDKGDFEIPTEDEPEDTGEEDTEPI